MIEFAHLALPALYQLQKDLEREIARRQVEDKQKALAELQQLAAERGFSLNELLGAEVSMSKRGGKRGPAAVQYVNPADPAQTWAGRGRKPLWVQAHLDAGGSLAQLKPTTP